MRNNYDVIVVGGGHAGCEAAYAVGRLGGKVLLITMDMNKIAQMSCNPAMGGVAKGQIIREIDALGGMSGVITDKSMIQFRMLNKSKGPAMWSPRSQNDRMRFAEEWRLMLEKNPNVDFWQEMVTEIIVKNDKVCGVKTGLGIEFFSKAVVLTNGTFLNGLIHIGEKNFGGGRAGEKSAKGITEQLVNLGFESGRMKTGTPPRVDGRTINYRLMEEQKGDEMPGKFSYSDKTTSLKEQRSCFITYTNEEVHEALKKGFDKSPMFNGRIQGLGPRYCPSIEDKINRFVERNRHQIFVEPEGWNTVEVYVNGFSTSLPFEVQYDALKKIKGFEHAVMFRPGYAIEYDFFPPTQLNLTLETKIIENLFFAGQINGTTGYEEAACQGLMAGINAFQKISNKENFILQRSEAYIGVLIDDLINKGTDEPYRMFTSRAEYRILLRQDNADLRLTKKGFELGLASKEQYEKAKNKEEEIENLIQFLRKESIAPNEINIYLENLNSAKIDQKVKLSQIIKRPQIKLTHIENCTNKVHNELEKYSTLIKEQTEILLKYETYIEKEEKIALKLNKLENLKINDSLKYQDIKAMSNEGREKLMKIKPKTIGQASRISGVSPADISILMVYLESNTVISN
ncbi:MAG: tRNA uridine-5-carboxymethylaminomethyl(34) synthesis enzyme MnmG [Bacteroidota bacterium]